VDELRVEAAVEVGVAGRPRAGEAVSGDLAVVERLDGGTLLAVVDGAGHGAQARRAALAAGAVVRRTRETDLGVLMEHCHHAMRGTRGGAVTLAFLAPARAELTWLGVGTVEGRVVRARGWPSEIGASLAMLAGTPGHDLPGLAPATLTLRHGDVVALATDGVRSAFADALEIHGSCREVAERVVREHAHDGDDALAVVARFLGGRS
jgi:phosphoserine phosphatase RsbX